MEIMQQLSKRINQLKTNLPIAMFTAIKEHALPTSNAAPNSIHVLQPFHNEDVMQPFHTLEECILFEDTPKLQNPSGEVLMSVPVVPFATTGIAEINFPLDENCASEELLSLAKNTKTEF
jgi:hypothetical protein